MKVIFCGKERFVSLEGLRYLNENGFSIAAVISKNSESLEELAKTLEIPVLDHEKIYEVLKSPELINQYNLSDVDLVISLLSGRMIKHPLIEFPKYGCINFHPGPLPECRGLKGYSFAILSNMNYYGVSAHYIDEEKFDVGPLIDTKRFPINPMKETAYSLVKKTEPIFIDFFKDIMTRILASGKLPSEAQPDNPAFYWSRSDLEEAKRIEIGDDYELIERKIRSFWHPPHMGASIELDGRKFTVISQDLIANEINGKYND